MKGLAKRNNKTRGKSTRKKNDNRKTIRKGKKRGGAGLEGMNKKTLQQQTDELIFRKNDAVTKLIAIRKRTDAEFKAAEIVFIKYVEYVKQLHKDTGYAESKHVDENDPPNKKTKLDNDPRIAAANTKLDKLMVKLQKERDTADFEYKVEMGKINNEFSIIKQTEQNQQETEDINAEKDEKTDKQRIKNIQNKTYLTPFAGNAFNVDGRWELAEANARQEEHDKSGFKDAETAGLTFNGGKKRKTHKKRK
jgi:hypothetical protein